MDLLESLGNRVRAARAAKGWTLKRLAEESGVSLRFVAEVEGGTGNISVRKLADLARALDVPIGALLDDVAGATPDADAKVIALVGLRGAGKSTIGRKLAQRTGRSFFELDQLIEAAAGMPLAEVFAIHGETYYRRLEATTLERFLDASPRAVLATGGGIVTNPDAFALLRRATRVVWLKAKPQDHWSRVVHQGDRRPMAGSARAQVELRRILRSREPLYRQAHLVADTSALGVSGTVDRLARELQ